MGGPQVNNRSPVLVTRCHYQVGLGGGICTVKSNASWAHGTPLWTDKPTHTQLETLPSHNFGGGQ